MDITLCLNHKCPLKEKCFRYIAKGGPHQSYATFKFFKSVEKICCDNYIPVNKK